MADVKSSKKRADSGVTLWIRGDCSPVGQDAVPSVMADKKPRLLIVGGAGVPVEALQAKLAEEYDLVILPEGTDPRTVDGTEADVVLAGGKALAAVGAGLCESNSVRLLNAIGEGVCLADAEGRILWSNKHFQGLEEQIRTRVEHICRQTAAWFVQQAAAGEAATGRRFEFSLEDRIYEVHLSPADEVETKGEAPKTVAAVLRDVTGARRLQQKMDAIDQAGRELVRLEAESVRKLNVIERLKLLEDKIVKYCHELLSVDHFAIRLIDERSNKLEIVMSAGLPSEVQDLDLYVSSEGNGISGYVAATGRSYVCHDTTKDERFLPGVPGAKSSLTVPLRLYDKVMGVMDFESQQVGAFSEDDRRFAQIFVRYIALALHMLDLMIVERTATNETVSGRVEGELSEPLRDIEHEAEWLNGVAARDPEAAPHIQRIKSEVEAIRRRVRNVATGPQTLLGAEQALADTRKDPGLVGRHVLVADDEPNVRRIIADVLRNRGCDVTVCANGSEAIEQLTDPELSVDLVISDIKMPDRNGYEVYSAARKYQPGVVVILMTGFGYDPHHSIVRASQEGLQCVLFKPFQVERLLEEVRKALTTAAK